MGHRKGDEGHIPFLLPWSEITICWVDGDNSDLLSCNSGGQKFEVSAWITSVLRWICVSSVCWLFSQFLHSLAHSLITLACLCGHISDWLFCLSLTKSLGSTLSCAHPTWTSRTAYRNSLNLIASADPSTVQGNTLIELGVKDADIFGGLLWCLSKGMSWKKYLGGLSNLHM